MRFAELFALLALLFGGLFGGWGDVPGGGDTGEDRISCTEVAPETLRNNFRCGPRVELLPKLPDRRE